MQHDHILKKVEFWPWIMEHKRFPLKSSFKGENLNRKQSESNYSSTHDTPSWPDMQGYQMSSKYLKARV